MLKKTWTSHKDHKTKSQNGWTALNSLKRPGVRLSELNAVALVLARLPLAYGSLKRVVARTAWARSLTARCSLAQVSIRIFQKNIFGFHTLSTQKSPIWSFQSPKLNPKDVYRSYRLQSTQTYIKLEIITSIAHNPSNYHHFLNFQ